MDDYRFTIMKTNPEAYMAPRWVSLFYKTATRHQVLYIDTRLKEFLKDDMTPNEAVKKLVETVIAPMYEREKNRNDY